MICAWNELLAILPTWLRQEVDEKGRDKLHELRLRVNAPPELVCCGESIWLTRFVSPDDLKHCINTASRYSPWAAATSAQGYITAPGGHRIGICGEAVCRSGEMTGVREISSLCIRVARDFPGLAQRLTSYRGSILIIGAPGWGKTTLLRDLIRQRSDRGEHIAVVDERSELFPNGFHKGKCTDILGGCPKAEGITRVLRTMGPECIAVDEITEAEDTRALLSAAWCGVKLLATAHAASMEDLLTRPVYLELSRKRIFETYVILHQDKSWHTERSS